MSKYLVIEKLQCFTCEGTGNTYKDWSAQTRNNPPCIYCAGAGSTTQEVPLEKALKDLVKSGTINLRELLNGYV
jgi:DnaJ-class molecular chaperone